MLFLSSLRSRAPSLKAPESHFLHDAALAVHVARAMVRGISSTIAIQRERECGRSVTVYPIALCPDVLVLLSSCLTITTVDIVLHLSMMGTPSAHHIERSQITHRTVTQRRGGQTYAGPRAHRGHAAVAYSAAFPQGCATEPAALI